MDPTKLLNLSNLLTGDGNSVGTLLILSIIVTASIMAYKSLGDVLKHFLYYVAVIICVLLLALLIRPLGEEQFKVVTESLMRILHAPWDAEKDETSSSNAFAKLLHSIGKEKSEGGKKQCKKK